MVAYHLEYQDMMLLPKDTQQMDVKRRLSTPQNLHQSTQQGQCEDEK